MAIDKIRRASSSSAATSNPSSDRVGKRVRKKKQPDDIWERYKDLLLTLWLDHDKPIWFVGDFMRTYYQVDLSDRQYQNRMKSWNKGKYRQDQGLEDSQDGSFEGPCQHEHSEARQPQATKSLYHDCEERQLAGLAAALGHQAYAFELLGQLCQKAVDTRAFRSLESDMLIASYLHTADTDDQRHKAQLLLQEYRPKPLRGPGLTFRLDILGALVQLARGEHDSDTEGSTAERIVRETITNNYDSHQPFKAVDVETCRAIVQAVWGSVDGNEDPDFCGISDFLDAQPMHRWCQTFCAQDPCKPSSLLDCIEWVGEKLKFMDLEVPAFVWQISETESSEWLNHCILFTSLYPIASASEPSWWQTSETETGTAPFKLLSTVCRMTLEMPSFTVSGNEMWLDESPLFLRENLEWETTTVLRKGSRVFHKATSLAKQPKDVTWTSFMDLVARLEVAEILPSSSMSLTDVEYWLSSLKQTMSLASQVTEHVTEINAVSEFMADDSHPVVEKSLDSSVFMDAEGAYAVPPVTASDKRAVESMFLDPSNDLTEDHHTFSQDIGKSHMPDLPPRFSLPLRLDNSLA